MPLSDTRMWRAVREKDPALDGQFWFGVLTTGIFCRPSCPARLPKQENVRFYETPESAQSDGLRPCKRCRPEIAASKNIETERFTAICRHLESCPTEEYSLNSLAAMAGLSPSHFQRRFKQVIGITPRQYLEACRLGILKQTLRDNARVSEAVYEAGFGSGSRVYEKLDHTLGMTPAQYRRGGQGLVISYASAANSFGTLMLGATDRGLCFLQFGESAESLLLALQQEFPRATLLPMEAAHETLFTQWMAWLEAYLQGERPAIELPLDIYGTAFQVKVWRYLQGIPYGESRSYTEVAQALGQPKAARAVASACAANTLAIVIPCHRVLRGSGSLAGYRWGLPMKQALLQLEQSPEDASST